MAKNLLDLRVSEPAQIARASLGEEDRRRVAAWFDHLRNWHNDPFLRSESRKLKPDEELYALQTSNEDLVLVFRISGEEVHVVTIVDRGWLRAFETGRERSAV